MELLLGLILMLFLKKIFQIGLLDIDDKTFNLSKEKWDDNYYGLGSDIAVAYYVKKFSKDNITFLTKKDISLKKFNEFDIIIALYEGYYYTNQTKDSESYKKYNNIVSKTKATVVQPLSLQKFVLNKKLYTDTLKKNNIPVVDTISVQIKDNMNVSQIIKKINKECRKVGNKNIYNKATTRRIRDRI